MARPAEFESATSASGGQRSIQLSYGRFMQALQAEQPVGRERNNTRVARLSPRPAGGPGEDFCRLRVTSERGRSHKPWR